MQSFVETMGQWVRADGWENVILGLGGQKDPSAYTTYRGRAPLSDELLEALYVEDHFAATIIEARPQWALRPGWALEVTGQPSEVASIADAYRVREELGVAGELAQGACWARVFGGSVTWVGADDGQSPELPLDESAIKSVRWLHTFDRRDVQVASYYTDPAHPRFRRAQSYRIMPRVTGAGASGVIVHESRCLVWPGQPTTDTRRRDRDGWDDSVLERCWDALRQVGEDHGAKSLTLGRISQPVFKIKDLFKMIAGKQKDVLKERMNLLDTSRSRARSILLDPEESFENVAQPVSGIAELIDKGTLRLGAAADMPLTILMGQSPAGMDATGESDLEVWATKVEAWREPVVRPRHERLARLILLSADGPTGGKEPASWRIKYGAVREPSRKELAEIGKIHAETDASNIDKGIYAAEVAAFRYAPGGTIQLDRSELDERLELRRSLASQPPKDNAELGTVGARAGGGQMDIVERVVQGRIPRESGIEILVQTFRLAPDLATKMLGPEDFVPSSAAPASGPAPDPKFGQGAGAPQPPENSGGAP
jgi:phage-related protein (TIGR01555 family)